MDNLSKIVGYEQEITKLLKQISKLENKKTEENREEIEKKIALKRKRLDAVMKAKNALVKLISQ